MKIYIVGRWYPFSSSYLPPTCQENLNHVKILAFPLKMLWQPKLDTYYNLNVKEIIPLHLLLLLLLNPNWKFFAFLTVSNIENKSCCKSHTQKGKTKNPTLGI